MSFQSLGFWAFLALALAVCLTAGRRSPRAGAALLTAASALFYLLGPGGWTVVLGGLACPLLGIGVTAWAVRRMGRDGGDRRRTLALACAYHIAVLAGFKYLGFFTGGAVDVGWAPLGLSFFTFQQLWLLKEVCTGEYVPAAGDSLLLYGLFFPTVTSGPILRPEGFFPQLRGESFLRPDWSDAAAGVYAICCGTIKKVLLADAFGTVVNNGWARLGYRKILCVQPFACLPNHVVGKGVIKELRRRHPESNIVAIDFDPGASEVNQLNRIKLMLSTAFKNLEKQ